MMSSEEVTIETLRWWSHLLLWVSIILPSLGAAAAGARYYIDRREKQLTGRLTAAAIQQAKTDATNARSELAELKTKTEPRHVSLEQRQLILAKLSPLKGYPVAFACRLMDGESCDYATELAAVFLEGGCQVPEPIKTSLNDLPGYLVVTVSRKR